MMFKKQDRIAMFFDGNKIKKEINKYACQELNTNNAKIKEKQVRKLCTFPPTRCEKQLIKTVVGYE